jgi:hypothetical protein
MEKSVMEISMMGFAIFIILLIHRLDHGMWCRREG